MKQSGSSAEAMKRGVMSLNGVIGKGGTMSQEMADAFSRIGIDPTKFNEMDTFIDSTIRGLMQVTDSAERADLTKNIFGMQSSEMAAFFSTGVDGFDDLKREAHELGLVMEDDVVANGVSYGDAVSNFQDALSSLKMNVVTPMLPMLTQMVQSATDIVAFFNPATWTGKQNPLDIIADSAENLKTSLFGVNTDTNQAKSLWQTIQDMGDPNNLNADDFAVWQSTVQSLIELIPDLAKSFDTSSGTIKSSSNEILATIESYRRARMEALAEQHLATVESQIFGAHLDYQRAGIAANNARAASDAALKDYNQAVAAHLSDMLTTFVGNREAQRLIPGLAEMNSSQQMQQMVKTLGLVDNNGALLQGNSMVDRMLEIQRYGLYGIKQISPGDVAGEWANYEEQLEAADAAEAAEKDAEAAITETEKAFQQEKLAVQGLIEELMKVPSDIYTDWHLDTDGSGNGSDDNGEHADGHNWIPYDGLYKLHRGESVLNYSDAADYRAGNAGSASIDYDRLGRAVANALSTVSVSMDGETVGRMVATTVDQEIGQMSYAGRYTR